MIICRKCSYSNSEADAFCGSCGEFLEWTGERVTPRVDTPAPAEDPEPAPAERRRGFLDRVGDAVNFVISPSAARTDSGEQWNMGNAGGGAPGRPGAPGAGPPRPAAAPPPPAPPPPPRPAGGPPPPPPPRPAGGPPPPPPPPPRPAGGPPPPPPPRPAGGPPPAPPRPPAPAPPPAPRPAGSADGSGRELADSRTAAMVADLDRPSAPGGSGSHGLSDPARRARATGAGEDAPDEVAPQRVRARVAPITRTAPTRRLQPGDLICGQCGEGNAPTRKFCSRCGEGLSSAEAVRAPWWRRFVPQRGPKTAAAGARPGRAGAGGEAAPRRSPFQAIKDGYRRSRMAIGVIGLALGILIAFVPALRSEVTSWFSNPVDRAKTRVEQAINPTFLPVRPVEVTASAARPKHPADLAFDQGSNTFWTARWDPDRPPRLIVTFAKPVNLSRLIVISGGGKRFTQKHRPETLHLVYSTRRSDTFAVPDSADPVTFTLENAEAVTTVEIVIRGIHPAQKANGVALAELEFFVKE